MVPSTAYLALSALLFTLGAVGVLTRRNALIIFMSVELMLNSVNLAFVTFARQHLSIDGYFCVARRISTGVGRHRGRRAYPRAGRRGRGQSRDAHRGG